MAQHIPADAPSPRLCLIKKTKQDQEYGFNLHAERNKSQYIGAVDSRSPAEHGGLREGDIILGVNGALISGESHKEVVQRIKSNPSQCELLVIETEALKWYESNGIAISYDLPNIVFCSAEVDNHALQNGHGSDNSQPQQTYISTARIELRSNHRNQIKEDGLDKSDEEPAKNHSSSIRPSAVGDRKNSAKNKTAQLDAPLMPPRPLLCHLRKQSPTEEFGFNLHAERGKGHFIGAVDENGIADRAGLETGQRIVGVNGELVYPKSMHKEVVALIKRDPLDTRLLVASEEVDRWYSDNQIPYSFDLAVVHETARQPSAAQSRTTTVASHHSAMENRHNSAMIGDDAATNAVFIPSELQSDTIDMAAGENNSLETSPVPTAPSASEILDELQDVDNAAVGIGETEDFLDQVFNRVKPPEVEAADLRLENGLTDVATSTMPDPEVRDYFGNIEDTKHLITNYNSDPLTVSPSTHVTGTSHAPPPVTYTPASQFGTGLSSPQSDKRSLDSPDSHKDENIDIFKMSAKEARQLMRHKRKDPRLQANMTLEEKHQLISNL